MAKRIQNEVAGNDLVVKNLGFMQSAYHLDIVELRLIALAIIVLRKNSDRAIEFSTTEPVSIHASLYADLFQTTIQNAYQVLQTATESLSQRRIKYVDMYNDVGTNNKYERLNNLNWTTLCSYVPDVAMIQICFSPQLIPFLIYLDENFAGYEIRNLVQLKSVYEFHLYELGVSWRNTGIATFKKETLRHRMGILDPNQFNRAANFNRLLKNSLETINKNTDLTMSFDPIYESNLGSKGRSLTKYTMKVKEKTLIERQALGWGDTAERKYKTAGKQDKYKPGSKLPSTDTKMLNVEDDSFLSSLGTVQSELRFNDEPVAKKEGTKLSRIIKNNPRLTTAAQTDMIVARPDENGNWDIDFIIANISKAKFQIVGMDRDSIPEDLLRALPEYERYKAMSLGENAAINISRNIIEKKIALSVIPGRNKVSDAMAEDGRKISNHGIKSLTSTEKNIVMHNTNFRSRYAPQGQSNPGEIDSYLSAKLEGDLSKIPELKTYLA